MEQGELLDNEKKETQTEKKKRLTDEVTEWFLTYFWQTYPGDLCGGNRNKGSRGVALKSMLRVLPEQEERDRMLANLQAQIRFDRQAGKTSDQVYRWPYCVTYINQRKYDDELESSTTIMNRITSGPAICSRNGCDRETQGSGVPYCDSCNEKKADPEIYELKINWLKNNNLLKKKGESVIQYSVRCRKKYAEILKTGTINKMNEELA